MYAGADRVVYGRKVRVLAIRAAARNDAICPKSHFSTTLLAVSDYAHRPRFVALHQPAGIQERRFADTSRARHLLAEKEIVNPLVEVFFDQLWSVGQQSCKSSTLFDGNSASGKEFAQFGVSTANEPIAEFADFRRERQPETHWVIERRVQNRCCDRVQFIGDHAITEPERLKRD
jgi:hypothetical protein